MLSQRCAIGGILLAVPDGFFPRETLAEAEQDGFPDLIGPHTVTTAQAVELSETGDWLGVYPRRTVNVLLVDLAERAASALEALEEGLGECVPFDPGSPMHFPLATALTSFAASWSAENGGDRRAGYVTAEELLTDVGAPPALGRRAKAEPKRKPTVAALAVNQL